MICGLKDHCLHMRDVLSYPVEGCINSPLAEDCYNMVLVVTVGLRHTNNWSETFLGSRIIRTQ